jgi:hypothetical protein
MPPEATGAPDGQAPTGTQPPEGTGQPQSGEPQTGTPAAATPPATGQPNGQAPDGQASGDQGTGDDRPVTAAELSEIRRENQSLRKRLRAYEGDESRDALATKVSDLEKQLAERDVRDRDNSVRMASLTEATKMKFRNPDLAYRLIDRGAVEFDSKTGEPKNVEALMKSVLDANPYLAGPAGGPDFGGGPRGESTGNGEPSMNELLRAAAGKG